MFNIEVCAKSVYVNAQAYIEHDKTKDHSSISRKSQKQVFAVTGRISQKWLNIITTIFMNQLKKPLY